MTLVGGLKRKFIIQLELIHYMVILCVSVPLW